VAVSVYAQFECQCARRFQTLGAIATGEREQSKASPITVLGMTLLLEKPSN